MIKFMFKIGRIKVTNHGIFFRTETISKNKLIKWKVWRCIFTGKPEHRKQKRICL